MPVYPTPTIGMIGIISDKNKAQHWHFQMQVIRYLIGFQNCIASSRKYLVSIYNVNNSPAPEFNLLMKSMMFSNSSYS